MMLNVIYNYHARHRETICSICLILKTSHERRAHAHTRRKPTDYGRQLTDDTDVQVYYLITVCVYVCVCGCVRACVCVCAADCVDVLCIHAAPRLVITQTGLLSDDITATIRHYI